MPKGPSLKCLVLDMDGTLLDTLPLCAEAWRRAGEKFGVDITEDIVRAFFGMAMTYTRDLFARTYGGSVPFEEIRLERMRIGRELVERSAPAQKPGASELLVRSRELGLKNVLATGTMRESAHLQLERAGLLTYIDESLTGESVSRGKPDPDIFIKAMEAAGASPEESIIVEDSEFGVRAGVAAGARVVLVPDASQPEPEIAAMAWRVLPTLRELIPIVEDLAK